MLISGHDDTFIPLMSAIAPSAWDQLWPPYSSLSTIELLRVGGGEGKEDGDADGAAGTAAVVAGGGDYFFRFVYNGQVLRLDGCDDGETDTFGRGRLTS